jgi:hypothetical protein
MKKSKLDPCWDDFFEQFVRTLIADGYNEWDILNKAVSIINDVRETHAVVEVDTPKKVTESKKTETKAPELPVVENNVEGFVPRYHNVKKELVINRKNHTNYPKTLSTKFEHAEVYILGAKDESLATIERGPDNKSRDMFRVVQTGEELTEKEYLVRFNKFINPASTDEWGYRNKSRIVFKVNPKVNVSTVKHPNNYYTMTSIDDIKAYVPRKKGRKAKKEKA